MTTTGLGNLVRETLSLVLGMTIPDGVDIRREREPRWDSLKHIEVVFALENALNIRFSEEQIPDLRDVRSIVEIAGAIGAPPR